MTLQIVKLGEEAVLASTGNSTTEIELNKILSAFERGELVEFDMPKGEKLTNTHIAQLKKKVGQMLHDLSKK
jgi:hypothetical protein